MENQGQQENGKKMGTTEEPMTDTVGLIEHLKLSNQSILPEHNLN